MANTTSMVAAVVWAIGANVAVAQSVLGASAADRHVRTAGNDFGCETLASWNWLLSARANSEFHDLAEMTEHGCSPLPDGVRATVIDRGKDYMKLRVTPSDDPPYVTFTSPENVIVATTANDREKAIIDALRSIRGPAGGTVYDRIQACGIHVRFDESFAEPAVADNPAQGIKRGDLILSLSMDVPKPPQGQQSVYNGLYAGWVFERKGPKPQNGWAWRLQTHPRPLGSAIWLNC